MCLASNSRSGRPSSTFRWRILWWASLLQWRHLWSRRRPLPHCLKHSFERRTLRRGFLLTASSTPLTGGPSIIIFVLHFNATLPSRSLEREKSAVRQFLNQQQKPTENSASHTAFSPRRSVTFHLHRLLLSWRFLWWVQPCWPDLQQSAFWWRRHPALNTFWYCFPKRTSQRGSSPDGFWHF